MKRGSMPMAAVSPVVLLSTAAVLSLSAATDGGWPWTGPAAGEQTLRQWVQVWTATAAQAGEVDHPVPQTPVLFSACSPVIVVLTPVAVALPDLDATPRRGPMLPLWTDLPPPRA